MKKKYNLEDIAEPNLLEDTFPYSLPKPLPPLINFDGKWTENIDGKKVTFDPAKRVKQDIHITDTTFRDGQQARPPYTVEQQVKLYEMISKLGGPKGVIRQTEFFLYTKNDREALDKCRELGLEYPEITGWIRAVKGDFRLVKEAGLKESGMLTSSSDYHIFYKQKQTRQEAFDQYIGVVESALETGVRPRCHLEDVTRADWKGFVFPFVQKLARLSEQVPEHLKVKVRLCDTMGFGVGYLNALPPRSIAKLCWYMNNECGIPPERLEWHGHNDFHKVHINGTTAWICGCNALNATLFGYGERTGNPPLEGAIMEYIALKGDTCGTETKMITEIANYMQSIGFPIPDNYPFAGKHFNTTRAGIHAGGLRRDERIYNIMDTATLLNRPPKVAITDKTGTDGIAVWVNEFLGVRGTPEEVKLTQIFKIQKWVMEQYNNHGRLTAISDEELEEQVKTHLPELYAKRRSRSSPVT
ncbi:MAG: 2-isopropylmalate synthase [Planctomycetota bacterium]|nr:MAG: 2-isopropylmalate synthase [Planctomycetota bacterium]